MVGQLLLLLGEVVTRAATTDRGIPRRAAISIARLRPGEPYISL